MSFPHAFCVACLVWIAAARKYASNAEVSITASGEINEASVVRRVHTNSVEQIGSDAERASTFAGLLRTDRFNFHRGLNCSNAKGGKEANSLAEKPIAMSLEKCKRSCSHDDACTCISYVASSGMCNKLRYCHVEDCVASSMIDTYVLHSTLKVPRGQRADSVAISGDRVSFDRSGGRDCTDALALDTGVADLSVTQCLTRCAQHANCTCVKYERYYQSECVLMANCQEPKFCTRSSRYDTYVSMTAPQPTPKTCKFQCSEETSADCMDEYVNAKTKGELPAFFSRCETEGGSAPLRSRCKLCCEDCAAGSSDEKDKSRTCNFQCGQEVSADCKTEFANSKMNGDLTPFHTRCETEGGSGPLRSRCNLCCDGCLPNANTTPAPPATGPGCCSFHGQCADCGSDGSGFCHKSESNCGVCGGVWDMIGVPPTGCKSGCCAFNGQCADCGTDGSGFCHESASNCAICTGNFDASGVPPANCTR